MQHISKIQPVNHAGKYTDTSRALVLAPGASLNTINVPALIRCFDFVIGMNYMMFLPWYSRRMYTVCHHTFKDMPTDLIQEAIHYAPGRVVLSEFDCFDRSRPTPPFQGDWHYFHTYDERLITGINHVAPIQYPKDGYMFAGSSAAMTAIGFAIAMGAKDIYCAGVDGGQVNGQTYWEPYTRLIAKIDGRTQDSHYTGASGEGTFAEVEAGHSMRTYLSWRELQLWLNVYTDINLYSLTAPSPTASDINKHTALTSYGTCTDRMSPIKLDSYQ